MEIQELIQIKRRAEDDLRGRRGVTGVDVGYKFRGGVRTDEIVIRIFVAKKGLYPDGEVIPATIEGIPTDVIEATFKAH